MAKLPKGSWDGQLHVFGEPFPLSPNRPYEPPPRSDFAAMQEMHRQFGFDHGVIVQAAAQGFDFRHITSVLARLPDYVGVILMNDRISDDELLRLHDQGVRGGRFVFLPGFEVRPDFSLLRSALPRLRDLGWFAKVFVTAADWPAVAPYLQNADLPLMIDHLGYVDPSAGRDQPAMHIILDLLKRDNIWMMLSCGDRISKAADWSDVIPYARRFIDAAPDRVVWGSDWPHVAHTGYEPPNDAIIDLLLRYARSDAELERVLVTNPPRFFLTPAKGKKGAI